MWHQSQVVTNHLLLDSEGLKCHPHRIFSSEVSLLPDCCLRKTTCRLFAHVLCPPPLACREQEQPEESCPAEPRLDFLVVWQHLRFLCRVSYFSMWLSILSWLCLSFCALCRVIQVSLCFLDWTISELCRVHLTDLVENDAEGVLMCIYWTFFFFLSIPLFLVFEISLMLLEVHCTVEHES